MAELDPTSRWVAGPGGFIGSRWLGLIDLAPSHARVNPWHGCLAPEKAPRFTEVKALRCRVRYFLDGLAIGSKGFIARVFGFARNRFGKNRASGARKLRRIDTSQRTLRDLQREAVGRA